MKKIAKLLLLFFIAKSIAFIEEDSKIPFDSYELENVEIINEQLQTPLEFKDKGFWNNRVDRYLFYSLGLEAMKKPLAKPDLLANQLSNRSLDLQNAGKWLNLGFYTLMSQSASHTLRSTANEAEFYIKRFGKMKTASGTLAITSGILGVLGLILAPFGGVALTSAAIGLGISSAMTGVPSAILDITNNNINQSPDYYARIANNQMKMVQKQGKFLNQFLAKALDVLEEESENLSEAEYNEIEKFMYLFEIFNFFHQAELQKTYGKKMNSMVKGLTATKAVITSLMNSHELDAIRKGYSDFKNALDDPSTINRRKAKDFIKRIFPNELNDRVWGVALDIDFEKELLGHPSERNLPSSEGPDEWEFKARKEMMNDFAKDPYKSKNLAKTNLQRKAYKANVKIPLWTKNIAESILPNSVVNWGKAHAKIRKF